MRETISIPGSEMISLNIYFVHELPVNPTVIYIVSNPYSLQRIRGKWHLLNLFTNIPKKKGLSSLLHI